MYNELQQSILNAYPSEPPKEQFAEMWYTFFRENGKTYRYLRVKIENMEIAFPAEERPALKMISEKAIERTNKDAWNERTVSLPLPTLWTKTGL